MSSSLTADEWQAIAVRAVACPGWRWLLGMLTRCGLRIFDEGTGETPHGTKLWLDPENAFPDFTDPLTLWGLVALVREAWGPEYDIDVFTKANGSGTVTMCVIGHYVEGRFQDHDHIARALVRALEAAPVRPVPCKV